MLTTIYFIDNLFCQRHVDLSPIKLCHMLHSITCYKQNLGSSVEPNYGNT
jgi:hypothetical protein